MVIKNDGKVGVGTTGPDGKLDIYTGSASTVALSFDRYASGNYRTDIYQNQYGPDFRVGYNTYTPESVLYLKRFSNGIKEVEINGNVGIGTGSPATYLHLSAKNSDPGATEGDSVGTHDLTEYLRFTSRADGGDVNAVTVGFKLGADDNSGINPHGRLDICANDGADAGNDYGNTPDKTIATFRGNGSTYIGGTPDDDWTYEAPCVHVNSLPRNLMHLRMPDDEGQTNSLKNFPYAIDGVIDGSGEQEFAMGSNPWGVSTMLWRNKGTSGGQCGGWARIRFRCSYRRSYMSVIFVKRGWYTTDATARFYHGCSQYNTSNLDGTADSNPYFHNIDYNALPRDVWCVSIGFVHHRGATTSHATGTGGIYRLDTMQKLSSSTEYKFKDESDYQEQRAFYYNNYTASRYLDFWNPGFYDMDTNVPELGFLKNFSYSVRTENLWVGQWQTKTWYGTIGVANTTTTIIVFDRSARGSSSGGEMCGELTVFCHRDGGNQHRAYAKFQVNYTHWYGTIWYGSNNRQHFNNNSGVSNITMSSDATAGTISVHIASTTNTNGQYYIKFDGPKYNP
jgi:hypothetical protein